MPYAWVQESVVYDEDTANGIKVINDTITFAYDVQLWSFVAAGMDKFSIFFTAIMFRTHGFKEITLNKILELILFLINIVS